MIVYNDFKKEKQSFRLWHWQCQSIDAFLPRIDDKHRLEGPSLLSHSDNDKLFAAGYYVWGRLHNLDGLAYHSDFFNSWCIHGVEVTDEYAIL